jgi:hypothetical protein
VTDWLAYGLIGRAASTVETRRILAEQHVIPALGARKLRDLSAEDVDRWLGEKAGTLSTRNVREIRAIARAQASDKVKRNVMLLCNTPGARPETGESAHPRSGRKRCWPRRRTAPPSAPTSCRGCSPEPAPRNSALTWSHVHLVKDAHDESSVPPHLMVRRSVRAGGDTKTCQSRRTLAARPLHRRPQ